MRKRGPLLALLTTSLLTVPVPASAKQEPPLRFATYNVCKTSCGTGQFSWDNRRDAVIRNILSARPDVLALQEVDNSHDWISGRLENHGYRMLEPADDQCLDSYACIDDSQLYYRTARVSPLVSEVPSEPVSEACRPYVTDDGELPQSPLPPEYPLVPVFDDYPSMAAYREAYAAWEQQLKAIDDAYEAARDQYNATMDQYRAVDAANDCERFVGREPTTEIGSGGTGWNAIGKPSLQEWVDNRNFTWALLQDRRSGGAFMAVSMHLPNEKTGFAEQYRVNLARQLPPYLNQKAQSFDTGSVPKILLGDFNSYWQRQPRGAQWILGRAGFEDAFSAKEKVNEDVPTVNVTKTSPNPFPDKPFRFDLPARIDYVMFSKGKALRYEVHLRLRDGRFDNRFRGSDHNLVLADLALPRVKAPDRWTAETG